jgi:hypothetical protein
MVNNLRLIKTQRKELTPGRKNGGVCKPKFTGSERYPTAVLTKMPETVDRCGVRSVFSRRFTARFTWLHACKHCINR